MEASFTNFTPIADRWVKCGTDMSAEIRTSIKNLQNTVKSPITTMEDHDYYARVFSGLRAQLQSSANVLDTTLTEAHGQIFIIATHTTVVPGPMAVKSREKWLASSILSALTKLRPYAPECKVGCSDGGVSHFEGREIESVWEAAVDGLGKAICLSFVISE
jgi:hypothetical protein